MAHDPIRLIFDLVDCRSEPRCSVQAYTMRHREFQAQLDSRAALLPQIGRALTLWQLNFIVTIRILEIMD